MKKLLIGLTLLTSISSFASEKQDMNTYVSLELKGKQTFFAPAERMEPLAEVYKKALTDCKEVFSTDKCSEGDIKTIRFDDDSMGIQVSVKKVYKSSGCSIAGDCKELESVSEIISKASSACQKFNTKETCEAGRLKVDGPAQRYNWKQ